MNDVRLRRERQRRYRQSAKGRATALAAQKRYAATERGRAVAAKFEQRRYARLRLDDAFKALRARWAKMNPQAARIARMRWMRDTPTGQRYVQRHRFDLPAALDALVGPCTTLSTMKAEIRHAA